MARRWDTRKKISDDKPKFIYELICFVLVIIAVIYSIATGSAPDNSGF